jgi:hypothetical protein
LTEPSKQERTCVTKLEKIFGGVTFALFIVGAIGFIIGVASAVLSGLRGAVVGGEILVAIGFNVAIWAGLLALVTGTVGRRHRLGKIGIVGAITVLALCVLAVFSLPTVY